MKSLSLEEENIIKYVRDLFRQVKEIKANKNRILRDIKNLFEYEKDIKNLFEHKEEEKNYHKPARVSNHYIEYRSNNDRN